MVRYLFYTIGNLTYKSPLVYFTSCTCASCPANPILHKKHTHGISNVWYFITLIPEYTRQFPGTTAVNGLFIRRTCIKRKPSSHMQTAQHKFYLPLL